MRIALDMDDTITAIPRLFEALGASSLVERCIVVTSRTNEPEARKVTEQELRALKVRCDRLYMLESYEYADNACPHDELDWHEKFLWQKVDICLREQVNLVFEDDVKVIRLLRRFAPKIRVIQVHL